MDYFDLPFRLAKTKGVLKLGGCNLNDPKPDDTIASHDIGSTVKKDADDKPFTCAHCGKSFRLLASLKKHMILHSDERPFSCSLCSRAFKLKNNLTKHMVMHTNNKPYTCQHCHKMFKRSSELSKHDHTVHQGKKYRVYKRFQCTLCPKAFTYQQALEDHQFVHTGVKLYKCNICGSTLCSNYNLVKHIKAHETKESESEHNKKPLFQCHICGASFRYSQSHRLHLRTIHGNAKPKCPICGKIVCSKKFLESHINTHTGEKPFCCEYCGRSFSSKNYLKVHVRGHTGETPFKCTICSKGFKQKSALTGHRKRKHFDCGLPS